MSPVTAVKPQARALPLPERVCVMIRAGAQPGVAGPANRFCEFRFPYCLRRRTGPVRSGWLLPRVRVVGQGVPTAAGGVWPRWEQMWARRKRADGGDAEIFPEVCGGSGGGTRRIIRSGAVIAVCPRCAFGMDVLLQFARGAVQTGGVSAGTTPIRPALMWSRTSVPSGRARCGR
jgi:hypothetical protein